MGYLNCVVTNDREDYKMQNNKVKEITKKAAVIPEKGKLYALLHKGDSIQWIISLLYIK